MNKRVAFCICLFVLSGVSVAAAQEDADFTEVRQQAERRAKKQRDMLIREIALLRRTVDSLKALNADTPTVPAMQSILDLKLAQEQTERSLAGARIVAADGTYLGMLGPAYDPESIFCSYGPYGATYSTKSIWCTYGDYGAPYNELSPFCPFSAKPPKIIVDGEAVASLTVGFHGWPVSISPYTLKEIFAGQ